MAVVKAKEIVVDALQEIVVQADEDTIPQSEAKAAIRALNDMMAMWSAKGVNLGFTEVTDMASVITVAPGAILGIKAALAIFLAPQYSVQPTSALIQKANSGWDAILDLTVQSADSYYPDTLPMGSGNTVPGTQPVFYPGPSSTILSETGGSVALEEDTEDDN